MPVRWLRSAPVLFCRLWYHRTTSNLMSSPLCSKTLKTHARCCQVQKTVNKFVSDQLDLIEEEYKAERQQILDDDDDICLDNLMKRGMCMSQLMLSTIKTGYYGRHIATFYSESVQGKIPTNVFSSGDIVMVHGKFEIDFTFTGVVSRVTTKNISVVFEGGDKKRLLTDMLHTKEQINLIKAVNDITYRRLKTAIKDLRSYNKGPSFPLIDILFGNAEPTNFSIKDIEFSDPDLNVCQQNAVHSSLNQRELSIIHGPPGTGKTTTVVEIIAQIVDYGQKVLACAPSNVAVDNLVTNLLDFEVSGPRGQSRKIKMVRLGHPARMPKQEVRDVCLDALLAQRGVTLGDVRSYMTDFNYRLSRCKDRLERQRLKLKRQKILKRYERQQKILCDVLSSADVVLATNASAHPESWLSYLKQDHFDVTVIDECGQALEASCWIPMLRARKCILAGDHLQLPPVILSPKSAKNGLAYTLLQRSVDLLGNRAVSLLTEQHRMHKSIMEWSSNQMYNGMLEAHPGVAQHLLKDLPGVKETEDTTTPMLLIDTAGHDMPEIRREESNSFGNKGEARMVRRHVLRLCQAGVDYKDIAIITPYSLQVRLLSHLLHRKFPLMEIKSVDGFQGREKEAVILSLVRSNQHGGVGFLADDRRLNVAVTRARRHLAVVCDSKTVSRHRFLRSLVEHIRKRGKVRTPRDYPEDDADDTVQSHSAKVT